MRRFGFNKHTSRNLFRGCTVAVLLAMTLLLTAGIAVHGILHKDAAAPGHNCAFVHWAHGEIGFAQTFDGIPQVDVASFEQQTPTIQIVFSSPIEFPQNSRGPPAV